MRRDQVSEGVEVPCWHGTVLQMLYGNLASKGADYFYHRTCLCNNFYGLSALVGCGVLLTNV